MKKAPEEGRHQKAATMSGGDEFLLKWNDHHNSFFNIMQELCANEVSRILTCFSWPLPDP